MDTGKKDMLLESPSGFMMPFESAENEDVIATLLYGEQQHPRTGQKFFHHGMDFVADHVPLYACASGTVVGVGNDAVHDNYMVCRYGKYEVKYGHISDALLGYGSTVTAGQRVAVSGDFLHLGVRFASQEIDPKDFIVMLITNIMQLESMGIKTFPEKNPLGEGFRLKTAYDKDQDEILGMMLRYIPLYFSEISNGLYSVPSRTLQTLRNIFLQSADRNYLFETMPDMSNPLGLTGRAAPLASKVGNTIVGDFLNYMALRHDRYLSTWDEAQKKTLSAGRGRWNSHRPAGESPDRH